MQDCAILAGQLHRAHSCCDWLPGRVCRVHSCCALSSRMLPPPCREHLSQLFTLAGESSRAVQGMATNPSAFWKSEHTRSVIAQEEALKRHVFLQMLHGGAPA